MSWKTFGVVNGFRLAMAVVTMSLFAVNLAENSVTELPESNVPLEIKTSSVGQPTVVQKTKAALSAQLLSQAAEFEDLLPHTSGLTKSLIEALAVEAIGEDRSFDLSYQRALWERVFTSQIVSFNRRVLRSPQFIDIDGYDIVVYDLVHAHQGTSRLVAVDQEGQLQIFLIETSPGGQEPGNEFVTLWQESSGLVMVSEEAPTTLSRLDDILKFSIPFLRAGP